MFKHFDDADISTEYSALMSKVMASGNHLIKMPINLWLHVEASVANGVTPGK